MANIDINDLINFENDINSDNSDIEHPNDYKWSTYFNEKIIKLSYLLKRTYDIEEQHNIRNVYNDLLHEAFLSNNIDETTRRSYISLLYRVMLYTRDIVEGKGEYKLFYILLGVWVKTTENLRNVDTSDLHKENSDEKNQKMINCADTLANCADTLANSALHSLVYLENNQRPYGSWKDIKYFLNYLQNESDISCNVTNLPIFTYAITLVVKQLRLDDTGDTTPSLLCKWLPREKSNKFGWLAKHIACSYFIGILTSGSTLKTSNTTIVLSNRTAERKCLTHYRQLIAKLNRKIKTPQINQCAQTWHEIDFKKSVSKQTLLRQRQAFQYTDKTGYIKGNNLDRLVCKENYEKHIASCAVHHKNIPQQTNSLTELVRTAIEIVENERHRRQFGVMGKEDEMIIAEKKTKESINSLWHTKDKDLALKNFVALLDTSGSMEGEPLLAALGLGCKIAENSTLGKGILTFSKVPKWLDLSCGTENLTDMVNTLITNNDWEMKTDIVAAMKKVLERCVTNNLAPDEIKEMVFVIFTDMKLEQADKSYCAIQKGYIKKMFKDEGLKSKWSTPFEPPKIIFWNMRNTTEYPTLTTNNNISVITGFTTSILESFCYNGIDALNECNPWSCLQQQLHVARYDWVEKTLNETDMFKDVLPATRSLVDEIPEKIIVEDKEASKSWWSWS